MWTVFLIDLLPETKVRSNKKPNTALRYLIASHVKWLCDCGKTMVRSYISEQHITGLHTTVWWSPALCWHHCQVKMSPWSVHWHMKGVSENKPNAQTLKFSSRGSMFPRQGMPNFGCPFHTMSPTFCPNTVLIWWVDGDKTCEYLPWNFYYL